METCEECLGAKTYFTEWSDAGEALAASGKIVVLYRPDPPDGTVEIQCHRCKGSGLAPEVFTIRTIGGPAPGVFRITEGISVTHGQPVSWPLPETLDPPPGNSGLYKKIVQSEIEGRPENQNIIRGAVYEWNEGS